MTRKDAWAKYNAKPETKQAKHEWYLAHKQRTLEQQREAYANIPEVAERKRKASAARYEEKKEEIRAYRTSSTGRQLKAVHDAKYYAKNGTQHRARMKNGRFKRKYNLSTEEVDRLIAERNGLCDICHQPAKLGTRLNVDHDHTTGEFRGMLCWSCNVGLGHLGDTTERLREAADYLERGCVNQQFLRLCP